LPPQNRLSKEEGMEVQKDLEADMVVEVETVVAEQEVEKAEEVVVAAVFGGGRRWWLLMGGW